jgi:glycosyltransferase involved in cell wall biosynthesis
MTYIIYDSSITGHHSEYLSHVVDYIVSKPTIDNFVLVVPEEIQIKFPDIIKKSEHFFQIRWEYIKTEETDKLSRMSLVKRSFKEFKIVEFYAKKFNAHCVYLMYFNLFQLALVFKRPTFYISGILFLQFYRMEKDNWKEKIKYYRKYWTTKLYSRNPKIKNIFVLNDQKTVTFLNHEFNTKIFFMLPDPIPEYEEEKGFSLHEYYKICPQKKILLHPGAIDPRKGTYEIIDSIDLLSNQVTEEYAILIIGKAKIEVDQIIKAKISSLLNTKFTIIFDNTFVSNERLKSLFVQSFAVLMPYKNPEASSGILGHAAKAGKPVITTGKGLLKEIVEQNNMGVLIDDCYPYLIANVLNTNSLNFEMNKKDNFVAKHTSKIFTETLLWN